MARRAASISRAVMRARLVDFRPNSPKATELPRWARPVLRPLNCLRYLVRLGCSMIVLYRRLLSGRRLVGAAGRHRGRSAGFRRHFGSSFGTRGLEDLTLEDPHLHADDAVSGVGLGQPVVDVGAEGVQRYAAFARPLGAGDLGAVQATRGAHLHTQGAAAHGAHHGALHRAAEHHALLDLLRNAVGHQLRIQLGLADLGDVDAHIIDVHGQQLRRRLTQLLDVLALLADHDARTRRLDGDVHPLGGALDQDAAHGSLEQSLVQELTHAEIRVNEQRKLLLVGIPLRRPVARDAEANADRIDLLTHALVLPAVAHGHGDMAVALDDLGAAAFGAGGKTLQYRRLIDHDARDLKIIDVQALVLLRVRDRGPQDLVDQFGALLGHELQDVERSVDGLAADRIRHQTTLLR